MKYTFEVPRDGPTHEVQSTEDPRVRIHSSEPPGRAKTYCDYCLPTGAGGLSLAACEDDWRVPGKPDDDKDMCHCGHSNREYHSFHVLFCRACPCYSFHRSGENYDDIHDRWH